jgi:hypothetical protein
MFHFPCNNQIQKYINMVISVKYFVLTVPHLSNAVKRYLPGFDLDLLGLKNVMENGRGYTMPCLQRAQK